MTYARLPGFVAEKWVIASSGSDTRGVRALHSVTAYASLSGLVLAQRRCEEKSNEITAIEALLPALSLKGSLVTIDAMGTQVAIAQAITERGGDYLLVVKDIEDPVQWRSRQRTTTTPW